MVSLIVVIITITIVSCESYLSAKSADMNGQLIKNTYILIFGSMQKKFVCTQLKFLMIIIVKYCTGKCNYIFLIQAFHEVEV